MKILLLLLFPILAFADNCENFDIKIIFDRKALISQEVVCTKITSDKMLFYISKSCIDNKCEVLKKKKNEISIKDYYNNTGSPGFKLCKKLSGVPQIFEFKTPKNPEWQSTSRCLFSNKDFVEISLLIKEWKSFIKK